MSIESHTPMGSGHMWDIHLYIFIRNYIWQKIKNVILYCTYGSNKIICTIKFVKIYGLYNANLKL